MGALGGPTRLSLAEAELADLDGDAASRPIMGVGPGSRFEDVISVDLPRPRDPGDPAFGEIYRRIERQFR